MSLWTACATDGDRRKPKAVSLEEAKKITAQFEGEPFTPPPRTINDIASILSQEKPDDLEAFEKAIAIADSEPQIKLDDKGLAEYYLKRARSAHEVGRAKQEIEDYRLAVKYGEQSAYSCYPNALMGLSVAEIRGGNWSQGIYLGEKVLSSISTPGRLAYWYSTLAWSYAKIGDLDSARKALDRADSHIIENNRIIRTRRSIHVYDKKWSDMINSANASGWAAYYNASGKLSEAEANHKRAIRLWGPYKDSSVSQCGDPKVLSRLYNWKVSELANNLLLQGRFVEAEVQARKAVHGALKSHGRFSAHTSMMITVLNKVIFEQGRFKEAEVLARENLKIYERTRTAKDSAMLADARSVLADAILAQKRWTKALSEYDGIREALHTDRTALDSYTKTRANLWLGMIKGGRSSEALALVRSAIDRKKDLFGEEHYVTAETHGIYAMGLAANRQNELALEAFSKAVPIMLDHYNRTVSGDGTQTARDFRFGIILESYIQLLGDIHGTGLERKAGLNAAAESFWLSDLIRGRTVKRALAASSARAATKNPELAEFARREQDALTQIGALNGLLSNILSAPGDQQNPDAVKNLRLKIDRLRSAHAALKKEIESRFPSYADLIDPIPVNVEEVQSILKPGEALVATFVGDNGSIVWAIPQQGSMVFSSIKLDGKRITKMVKSIRTSLGPPSGGTLGDIPDFDIETGYRLYEALLKPVEVGWKDAKAIVVVPHGTLGFLPISILPTKAVKLGSEKEPLFSNYREIPWLACTHSVTTLPSVASLRTLRSLPEGDLNRRSFTGFANPYFSLSQVSKTDEETKIASVGVKRGVPFRRRGLRIIDSKEKEPDSADLSSLPPLPDTADEVTNIAIALKADPKRDVFLGKLASEDQVKSLNLSDVKVEI